MKTPLVLWLTALSILLLGDPVGAHGDAESEQDGEILPPAFSGLRFEPPVPGSYELPAIKPAADGEIRLASGEPARLAELYGDKVVVLSFVYTHCADAKTGCPLATFVLSQVKAALREQPALARRVRLLTLSFDPARDTPEQMRRYGAGLREGLPEWRFATTDSGQELEPILEAYDQPVTRVYDEQGDFTGRFNHILRVFLIDRQQRIRNIYNVSFLHKDVLINDIKTLLRQATNPQSSQRGRPGRTLGAAAHAARWLIPEAHAGDQGASGNREQLARLIETATEDPPLGLPAVSVPADNPLTVDKVELGRRLFLDRRLSLNNTISCAMCHVPEQAFTSHELKTAVGLEGRSVRRNAPTLYNAAYHERFFHDARTDSLEHQIWGRLLAHNEMANASVSQVLEKIEHIPDYDGRFEAVFGSGPNLINLGRAIASFERILVSGNSAFDRWHYGGEEGAVSEQAKRGFDLFRGKAGCVACHPVGRRHALFTDHRLHNTGLGWRDSHAREPSTREVEVAPGVVLNTPSAIINQFGRQPRNDLGLYEVTQNPDDRWLYKTPTLRNVAITAPYMHNGAFETLEAVVRFYNQGGFDNELLDPLIRPLNLEETEIDALVAFMRTLTGDNVDALVAMTRAAPVGDLGPEDPHWSHDNRIDYGRP